MVETTGGSTGLGELEIETTISSAFRTTLPRSDVRVTRLKEGFSVRPRPTQAPQGRVIS